MTTPVRHTKIARSRTSHRSGFTLVELLASMTIMTILMGGMASALIVASHAIPDSADPMQKRLAAADVVDQIAGELFYATSITEETATAVTFTVVDRGHGSTGPETIRYEWSGTPGTPLTRQYNGGTVVNECEAVQLFNLEFTTSITPLQWAPKVLLVVGDDGSPNAQDLAKQALIESFGFSVQMVAAYRSAAEFSPLIAANDVMYISDQITPADILDKSLDLAIGIVTEKRLLYVDLKFSAGSDWDTLDLIHLSDNTHEITSPFAIGNLTICDSDQKLAYLPVTNLAPGLQVLAIWGAWPELAVLDVGADQYGGGTARGRRVKLPWGAILVSDINSLNTDGQTIMRRSIAWAAAPVVYTGVQIVLKPSVDTERLRTEVQVLNKPLVNDP